MHIRTVVASFGLLKATLVQHATEGLTMGSVGLAFFSICVPAMIPRGQTPNNKQKQIHC